MKGSVIWFTGFSGSGKTTIALLLKLQLEIRGLKTFMLDGDTDRDALGDNDHSEQGAIQSSRRLARVARQFEVNGIIVLVSKISPYKEIREAAKHEVENFHEVYVECSIGECARRDPKGIYRQAIAGELTEVTGMGNLRVHQYDIPEYPFIVLNTEKYSAEDLVTKLMSKLIEVGAI